MYYNLDKRLCLRGWQKTTCALVDLTGAIVGTVDNEDFSFLMLCDGVTDINEIFPQNEKSEEIIKKWLDAKIITESDMPNPISDYQKYRYYDNRYFYRVHWSITGRCNYKCRHCYMDAPDAQLGELGLEEIKDIANQLADCGIRRVSITGGEPLVRPDFWNIVDHLIGKDIWIEKIYSNGWLINARFISELKGRNIQPAISISFDGIGWHDWMRGVPGAEERAIQALKLCMENELKVDVEFCLHNGNKHIFRETINYLSHIGVPFMKVGTVVNTPLWKVNACGNEMSQKEYYDALLEYIPHFFEDGMPMNVLLGGGLQLNKGSRKYSVLVEKSKGEDESSLDEYMCGAARFGAYITADGRFLPCMAFTSVEVQKDFPLIRDLGVKQCMSDSFYMNFVGKRVKDLYARNTECNTCEFRLKCCGGCRALAMFDNNGDLYACDPDSCFLFKNGYPEKFRKAADDAIAKYCKEKS